MDSDSWSQFFLFFLVDIWWFRKTATLVVILAVCLGNHRAISSHPRFWSDSDAGCHSERWIHLSILIRWKLLDWFESFGKTHLCAVNLGDANFRNESTYDEQQPFWDSERNVETLDSTWLLSMTDGIAILATRCECLPEELQCLPIFRYMGGEGLCGLRL